MNSKMNSTVLYVGIILVLIVLFILIVNAVSRWCIKRNDPGKYQSKNDKKEENSNNYDDANEKTVHFGKSKVRIFDKNDNVFDVKSEELKSDASLNLKDPRYQAKLKL